MAAKNWNPEQLAAIEDRGGDVLVSAAAGSGKTTVLVERVIRLITDTVNPVEADRLLIATFSKSAAAEMKTRIRKALADLSAANPGNEFFRRQQALMERAHISTIHSFCSDVVKENFSFLGIQPNSRIANDYESAELSAEALSEVIEKHYKANDADFISLSENLSSEKEDGKIEDYILALHKFLRSLPHYENWIDKMRELYDTTAFSAGNTEWGKIIFDEARNVLNGQIQIAKELSDYCSSSGVTEFNSTFQKDIDVLSQTIDALSQNNWEKAHQAILSIHFPGLPPSTKCPIGELIKSTRTDYKNKASGLASYFSSSEDEIKDDIQRLSPYVECLFNLTMEYDEAFSKRKAERHILDYPDLEQFTVRVLTKPDGKGNYVPSDIAKTYSERFDYILIDEFQDTNKVQDTIFSSISKGGNSFFVGDVKQSIYRFRQAMPELFLEKYNSWKLLDVADPSSVKKGEPRTIILGKNYRSRPNITDGVNFIFRQIMHSDCVEIEYNKNEELVPAAAFVDDGSVRNEFHVINCEKETPVNCEAEFVAARIHDMVESKVRVSGGDGLRECRYDDFCILLRNAAAPGKIYADALRKAGIPYVAESGVFLVQPEIIAILDLLEAADNPLLEIPLCGAMLSEIFAFTTEEISEIKLLNKKIPLYSAVKLAAKNGDKKAENFINTLELIRRYAAFESSDSVISRVYSETLYPQMMRGAENGELKLANLRLLIEYAKQYEDSGRHGLSSFLRHVKKFKEAGSDFKAASPGATDSGAVKIMSIHKSKGLEFPVVFLCGTGNKLKFDNGSSTPYLNSSLGLACLLKDSASGVSYRSMPQNALKIKTRDLSLAEEMRIIYVALTRAKDNLIITCAMKNAEKELQKYSAMASPADRLNKYEILDAKHEADWLLPVMLKHPDAGVLRKLIGIGNGCVINNGTRWKFSYVPSPAAISGVSTFAAADVKAVPDPAVLKELADSASWKYKYSASEHIPVKAGVSSLTHQGIHKKLLFTAKPSKGGLSGAERGTALHTFMQFCDFELAEKSPADEIKRLCDMKFITEKQADTIDPEKVAAFFNSELYRRIKASGFVRRELRFLQSLSAKELGYDDAAPEDKITVQGVADCVFEENGKIVVVDYKTDYVDDIAELSERYAAQLIMYERLLSESLGKEVSGAVIWSFHFGKEIEI